jgi:hypothetical protein
LAVELVPHEALRVGGSAIVRDVELFGASGEAASGSSALRFGGEGYARLRFDRYRGELRGRVSDGFGGRRVGVQGRFSARLPGERVSVDVRGILLGIRPDLQPREHQLSLGYVVGAEYQMSPEAALLFELEHNYGHLSGQQLRFLVLLDLELGI